jgi:peptide/nickel transport system substrate-binding protein
MTFWVDFFLTFLRRKKWLILWVVVCALILSAVIYFMLILNRKGELKEGMVGTHEERDLPIAVLNLISKPLIRVDKTGSPSAELAEGWEVNPEATVYKVKIKPGLSWSDGKPIKAGDIYLSIPDVEINVVDEQTLEFKLAETFSPFTTLLSKPVLRKAPTDYGFELVGVGPYSVSSVKKDGPFVKKLDLIPVQETEPEVDITFYPNEKIAKAALKLGEVQVLLGATESEDLNFNNLAKKEFTNYTQLVTIFLNTEDPLLSDENLRIALAFGAPEIPGYEVAKTSLSPYSWAFNDKNARDYLANQDKAEEYLKKVQKGKDETITLTSTSSLAGIGEKVVESWNNLGLKTVSRAESGIPQNFQALLITQNIPADPDQYSLWHSTQKGSTNISRVASPRIDKDLEDGRKITDPEKRKEKYQDFQKILLDEAPAIFLYFPKYEVLYMKKVESDLNKVIPLQLSNLN